MRNYAGTRILEIVDYELKRENRKKRPRDFTRRREEK